MLTPVILLLLLSPATARLQPSASFDQLLSLSRQSPDSAFVLLREMLIKAREDKNVEMQGNCLRQMGLVSYHVGQYARSLDFHLQAADCFSRENKQELLAANYNDLGNLYYYNKQPAMAMEQYKKALAIYSRFHNRNGLAECYGHIGHLWEKKAQHDSAFSYQRRARLEYEATGNKAGLAEICEHLGSIFEDLERYDSAGHYFNQALTLYKAVNNSVAAIAVENNLGDILRKTGRYRESITQMTRVLHLATAANDPYQEAAALRDLAKAWRLLNQNDSAYEYLDLSRTKLLDIYSMENSKQLAFLQVMNETEKMNTEIEKLQIEHRNTIMLSIAGVVVLLLLVAIGALVISRQRLKIKNEKAVQARNLQQYESQKVLMQADIKSKELQEQHLKQDLDLRARELSAYTLHIIQKNQLLEELRGKLEAMVKDDKRDQKKQLQQLIHQINHNFNHDQYWGEFRSIFEQVHQSFLANLKKYAANLTANDLKLVSLIKMNLAPADIATLLGISPESLKVARYRLRKKINMPHEENLNVFIQSL